MQQQNESEKILRAHPHKAHMTRSRSNWVQCWSAERVLLSGV